MDYIDTIKTTELGNVPGFHFRKVVTLLLIILALDLSMQSEHSQSL